MSSKNILSPLAENESARAAERKRRRNRFNRMSVVKEGVGAHLMDGWQSDRELKQKTRLKRPKTHDEILENRVWLVLDALGYHDMSIGRNFRVSLNHKKPDSLHKQVDVFAKDDETVVVVECKSNAQFKKRSLQKDIGEFSNNKKHIAESIKKYYGSDFMPVIIWMFATDNIQWSKEDEQRARDNNIATINSDELVYFEELATHLGYAARYQFLAYYLKNQKIKGLANKKVPAIRGKLGGVTFYAFVLDPESLVKISFVNHRTLDDMNSVPAYQRLMTKHRLNSIKAFIDKGGFFPTNIILSLQKKPGFEQFPRRHETEVKFGNLVLPDSYKSAWVIDGQHRLYSFSGLECKSKDESVFVIAFENLSHERAASMFVDINHEQKTVSKNLIDDLKADLDWESEDVNKRLQATCARLVKNLNSDIDKPFYNRVVQTGLRPSMTQGGACLTLSSMKEALEKSKLLGSYNRNTKDFVPGPLSSADPTNTLSRSKVVINGIFSLIQQANTEAWLDGSEIGLCRNSGFYGIIRLFADCLEYEVKEKSIDHTYLSPETLVSIATTYLNPLLDSIRDKSSSEVKSLLRDDVPLGAGELRETHYKLVDITRNKFPDFGPHDFDDWKEARNKNRRDSVSAKINDINQEICSVLFEILHQYYQTESYLEKAVADKAKIAEAYGKSLDDPEETRSKSLEEYLSLGDYKKIIARAEHWKLVKPIFDIPIDSEKGKAKNLTWIDRLIPIRNKISHPTRGRPLELNEIEFVEKIHEALLGNIANYKNDTQKKSVNR
jgi:DNA sulfur modification protein DndB